MLPGPTATTYYSVGSTGSVPSAISSSTENVTSTVPVLPGPNATTYYSVGSTGSVPSAIPASPSADPPPKTTCDALKEFVKDSNFTCVTNEACDGVDCSLLGAKVEVIVLPCNDPPGISLKMFSGETVAVDQIVTNDAVIDLEQGTLSVTLDQLVNAIGLEVCAIPFSLPFA